MTSDAVDIPKLVAICRANGATWIAVFGSVARGEAGPTSDVDLLVRFDKPKSLLFLARLERELGEALGREIDLLTEAAISPHLRPRIEQEMQVLYAA